MISLQNTEPNEGDFSGHWCGIQCCRMEITDQTSHGKNFFFTT